MVLLLYGIIPCLDACIHFSDIFSDFYGNISLTLYIRTTNLIHSLKLFDIKQS